MNQIALGRDDLIKVITRTDLYKPDGAFASIGAQVQSLWPVYVESGKNSKCKCGPDPAVLFPLLDALFALLQEEGETGDNARNEFKTYMSARKGFNVDKVTLYFRKGKEPKPAKVEF